MTTPGQTFVDALDAYNEAVAEVLTFGGFYPDQKPVLEQLAQDARKVLVDAADALRGAAA